MAESNKTSEMRVAVDYRPSRKIFSRATHATWMSQTLFQTLIFLMMGLWAASSFAAGAGARLQQQLPTFTYLLLAMGFYFIYPSIAFAADARNREDVSFEFTRSGVSYRKAGSKVNLPWSGVSQATETKGFYILALAGRQPVAVPKFTFQPGEEQRFRLLTATSGVPIRD